VELPHLLLSFLKKDENSCLFSASSSPKKLTDYAYLFVVKEFSINWFQVNQNRERDYNFANILIDHWT
jgi:hypothetical protein